MLEKSAIIICSSSCIEIINVSLDFPAFQLQSLTILNVRLQTTQRTTIRNLHVKGRNQLGELVGNYFPTSFQLVRLVGCGLNAAMTWREKYFDMND